MNTENLKGLIASELIIVAREEKDKRPTELNFEELIDVTDSIVKKLILYGVVVNEANPNTKEHQAKLLRENMKGDEELGLYSEVALCGKPNCNRQKLDNSPLCSYHWDIANS